VGGEDTVAGYIKHRPPHNITLLRIRNRQEAGRNGVDNSPLGTPVEPEQFGEMAIPEQVIGRILNHTPIDSTSSVCNQCQYIEEKRQALHGWGARIAKIVSGLELIAMPRAEA
jgi:hypothetical protein